MASSEISLEAVSSIRQISADEWDACANPQPPPGLPSGPDRHTSSNLIRESSCRSNIGFNPFVSHAFFAALEASGSACPGTGWGPRHLLVRLNGGIAGIVPCY